MDKTDELLLQSTSLDLPKILNWPTYTSALVVGADNCAYYNDNIYKRDGSGSHFINTINWYVRYPSEPLDPFPEGAEVFINDYRPNKEAFR